MATFKRTPPSSVNSDKDPTTEGASLSEDHPSKGIFTTRALKKPFHGRYFKGKEPPSIAQYLFEEPWDFEFPQAVRILQKLNPKYVLGENDNPRFDPIHFQSHIDLNVSSSEIKKLKYGHSVDNPSRMTITFLGIAGIQGPLPDVFTEIIMDRIKVRDEAPRDFLDIFNHRLAIFWYKFYCKLFPGLKDSPLKETAIGESLMDIAGSRYHEESTAIIPQSTLFWQRSGSAIGLERAIHTYFNIPCRIRPFMGGVNRVKTIDQTQLGKQYHELGYSTMLGTQTFDQGKSFRINLGTLSYDQFEDFLPPSSRNPAHKDPHSKDPIYRSSGYYHLKTFIAGYFDSPRDYSIQLVLHKNEVPKSDLSGRFALSRNAWLNPRGNFPAHANVVVR